MHPGHELAHLNVARLKAPYADPLLADFVARIAGVNAVGDASPGFVWRLEDGSDEAGPDPFADPLLLVNLSVWADLGALRDFVHGVAHAGVMQRRRQWFEPTTAAPYVLWWIAAGTRPTLAEAKRRLELLRVAGPSGDAFTFAQAYPPPASPR